jgi:RNA polymerase sigma-70 factor (ECF subfamily)
MKREVELPSGLSSEAEFGNFFRRNYKAACLIALKYVKDYPLAEDLVQDVFIAFWEKRENYQVRTNLQNYFFTAVKNHSINLIQRNKSITTSLSELFVDVPEEDNTHSFHQEELAVRVYNAIQELPQACQAVFRLAYEQNYSYQEIADTLHISKNTVKTQMGIAYKQLRDKLNTLIFTLLILFRKNN